MEIWFPRLKAFTTISFFLNEFVDDDLSSQKEKDVEK